MFGDDVNVRAGPGRNYDVITRLRAGEKLAVLREAFGWYAVRPVSAVRVFIHKDFVEAKGSDVGFVISSTCFCQLQKIRILYSSKDTPGVTLRR